jgi:adenylate kinase family enzyme
VKEHEDSDIKSIINDIRLGKCLSDEAVITLIEKRTSLYDCSKGWILDGLPLNKRQCEILNKKAIIPTIVLSVRMSELEIKKKVINKAK